MKTEEAEDLADLVLVAETISMRRRRQRAWRGNDWCRRVLRERREELRERRGERRLVLLLFLFLVDRPRFRGGEAEESEYVSVEFDREEALEEDEDDDDDDDDERDEEVLGERVVLCLCFLCDS